MHGAQRGCTSAGAPARKPGPKRIHGAAIYMLELAGAGAKPMDGAHGSISRAMCRKHSSATDARTFHGRIIDTCSCQRHSIAIAI